MDFKEIRKYMLNSFFVIFSGSVLAMYANRLIFGNVEMHVHDITALLVLTVFCDLGYIFHYSRRELSRKQIHARRVVHLVYVLAVVVSVAIFMGWVTLAEPLTIFVLVSSIIAVYVLVGAVDIYRSKKIADKLNVKLKERYK